MKHPEGNNSGQETLFVSIYEARSTSVSSIAVIAISTHSNSICKRMFKTKAAFHQHLESALHKPFDDIKCLASGRCKARFTSPSALLPRLESGACHSGLTSAKINELIVQRNTSRLISRSTNLRLCEVNLEAIVTVVHNVYSSTLESDRGLRALNNIVERAPSKDVDA